MRAGLHFSLNLCIKFFLDFTRVGKVEKVSGKRVCVEWVIFGPKINTYAVFSKSVHLVFLKLYRMADTKKWLKVYVWIFKE